MPSRCRVNNQSAVGSHSTVSRPLSRMAQHLQKLAPPGLLKAEHLLFMSAYIKDLPKIIQEQRFNPGSPFSTKTMYTHF